MPVLTNAFINKTFDLVVMCIDANNFAKSCMYMMDLYTTVMNGNAQFSSTRSNQTECRQMPFVIVLTKGDKAVKSAISEKDIEKLPMWKEMSLFCYRHRLLWPPVYTYAKETAFISRYLTTVVNDKGNNNNDNNDNKKNVDLCHTIQTMEKNVS